MLPDYTGIIDREKLIKKYFNACYTNEEIIASLFLLHGNIVSLRHLKRLLKKYGLKRRKTITLPDIENIIAAIETELQSSGKCIGYKAMWKRLKLKYGLMVNRDLVLDLLNILDPEGIERRTKHRLLRRKYVVPGPNFIWHIDGYDKLKPFGFAVHGAIDGYSRKLLWLEVSSSNNNPGIIATTT
ncbi:uncharacterized protein LOC144350485 [Saccoglossus kowalevskii]